MTTTAPTDPLIRLAPAAAAVGVAPDTLRKWAGRRIVPCYRPTRRCLLFRLSEVNAALAKYRTGAQV